MQILAIVFGPLLILTVLVDAFETIVLPRTVRRAFRPSSIYVGAMSVAYLALGKMRPSKRRQGMLNSFAPLVLVGEIAFWAAGIMVGFGLLNWGCGTAVTPHGEPANFADCLYYGGVTFFTLSFGDVVPTVGLGRAFSVLEAGLGLGFLALIIAYIPVIYSAFSRREVQMLLLDSKAGSQPTATELLRRHSTADAMPALVELLKDWETFSAQLLESYLSYPVLAYYRSQHDDQNWLHSLCAIMDTCALIEAGLASNEPWMGPLRFQASATFAMARHVIVDLAYILDADPVYRKRPRLPEETFNAMCRRLRESGVQLLRNEEASARLTDLRELYEPFVCGLSKELTMDLPAWISEEHLKDNWETTAWDGAKHF